MELLLWPIAPLANDVPVMIIRWRVIDLERYGVFLIGFSMHDAIGRATSQIQHWDYEARSAVTRSGSRYVLLGPPGYDVDGMTIASARMRAVGALLERKPRALDRSDQIERLLTADVHEYRTAR